MSPGADETSRPTHVALVGPCAVGKSTVGRLLAQAGYKVSEPAQEHSGIPDMWRSLTNPDVLVYLQASLATLRSRRPTRPYTARMLADYEARLAHARANAHLTVVVDDRTAEQVADRVVAFLESSIG